ncbi:MAG: pacL [Deltaproteobacteria bacterium]|nr:pacL [Deltaproteobacteria bacterium]
MPEKWHLLSGGDLVRRLETDTSKGLSLADESRRLKEFSPNRLTEKEPPSALFLFLEQFNNFIAWLLIAELPPPPLEEAGAFPFPLGEGSGGWRG